MSINTQENEIKILLWELWLGESEIDILLLSYHIWPSSISQLASQSRIWRITVHEIVRRLIVKWLMLESFAKNHRLVYPAPADAISWLLAKKKQEIIQLEKVSAKTIWLLHNIQSIVDNLPNMRSYKWPESIKILKSELIYDKEDIYIMSDGQHFYDLIDNDFLEQSVNLRSKNNINVKLLFPSGFDYFTFTQWMVKQKLDIKFWKNEPETHWWVAIWGNKVAFCCYDGKYLTTSIINNESISNMMKYIYNQIRLNN